MSKFTWIEEYSVGIISFDRDHRKLIEYINQIQKAMGDTSRAETVSEVLGDLVTYARTHFQAEEGHMELAGFSGLKAHAKEHKLFLLKVVELCGRANYDDAGVSDELYSFLQNWLTKHILEIDMAYHDYYQQEGLFTEL